MFEPRCSPFTFMGPKRYTPAPCSVANIPIIDAVLISHSHYDHLSHPTVLALKKAHPGVHFFVPLRLKQWFLDAGIQSVTELDWWEETDINLSNARESSAGNEKDIVAKIGCLPCQHTSARSLTDRGVTLWASWSVESAGKKVWFGGFVDQQHLFNHKDTANTRAETLATAPFQSSPKKSTTMVQTLTIHIAQHSSKLENLEVHLTWD